MVILSVNKAYYLKMITVMVSLRNENLFYKKMGFFAYKNWAKVLHSLHQCYGPFSYSLSLKRKLCKEKKRKGSKKGNTHLKSKHILHIINIYTSENFSAHI